ncbi:uncharacterized protein LOC141821717 [Curcuma longa]|uniref:uncharacterized protein LOC141821717 n=1 Tax=Curcuma longa TaxID=136217 RepID=UPI003D9F3BF1
MITGGATDGDSNRARKAHSRQLEVCGVGGGNRGNGPTIDFRPQDLEGVETPHDDALVIKAIIANYDISRVFVNTGSSVNIIFKKAFDQMQIDEADLEPMATSLYGFTGNEVRPLGQIRLAISLGEEPTRRVRYSFFTIVDAPSSYNVILGRPTLSIFSAIVSTYHQKIKFPVEDLVGEARGDQFEGAHIIIWDWCNEGDHNQGSGPRDPRAGNQDNAPRGSILMILGGATDGDSNRARKSHSRQLEVCGVAGGSKGDGPTIGFGPQDLEGVETPHNDALFIKATIANYDISRVFVDTGSSVNIIFKKAFDQMQIDEADLEPMATSLYGFTGNEVRPLGQIRLAISLGEEPTRRTRYSFFTIVDVPSSYNVILGRPTLSVFSTAVSTYHQMIKFPVGDLVGEARGNQMTARRCYVDAVRTEARKARQIQGAEVHSVQEVPNPHTSAEKELLQVCPARPETTVQVAAELLAELKAEMVDCLLRNQDVFAWTSTDLTGVAPSVAIHRLIVLLEARPIKQKRRYFGPEQNKIIREEVQKLLKAGYIKEIHFPTWLSNVVLVPKSGNKWRNAGATYQRLIDKIFYHQQDRNIEMYVDDILIKSERGCSLITDIEETCGTLRRYGLKLNPAKCLFGVRVGKFLGYIVTEKGIEANPDKVQALSQMSPPRNLREAQRLMGRINALSQFISRSAECSLPFFKVLKRAQKFEWDKDCDKAFSELKEYLSQLPGSPNLPQASRYGCT